MDPNGVEIEAVVLGRVLNLMKRYLSMDKPHLWVVYPRSRDAVNLHLQIAGIWEPSTLDNSKSEESKNILSKASLDQDLDEISEGDDYFSIRGELIYTRPESNELVIKIRPQEVLQRQEVDVVVLKICGALQLQGLVWQF